MLRVGFMGLGLMGNPMAKNIIKAGFPLTVYNRTSSKTKEFEKLGAKVARTPKKLAENSDVVITMVTAGKDVENIMFNKDGVVFGAKPGLVVIDMSTIGPTAAKEISEKLRKYKVYFIDAPVAGSIPKAEAGELSIFVGGDPKVFKKVETVLRAMGKIITYMGKTGSGQAIKIVNNQLHPAIMIALSEGMLLADSLGLPRKKVVEALSTTTAMSPTMMMVLPNYATNKFPLKFSIANLKKDVTLALGEAKKSRKNFEVLKKTQSIFAKAVRKGLGSKDFSAIIKILDK